MFKLWPLVPIIPVASQHLITSQNQMMHRRQIIVSTWNLLLSKSCHERLMCCKSRAMFMTLLARMDRCYRQAALCSHPPLIMVCVCPHDLCACFGPLHTFWFSPLVNMISACEYEIMYCRPLPGKVNKRQRFLFSFLFPAVSWK